MGERRSPKPVFASSNLAARASMCGGGRLDMHSAVYRDEAGSIPVRRANDRNCAEYLDWPQGRLITFISAFDSRLRNQVYGGEHRCADGPDTPVKAARLAATVRIVTWLLHHYFGL